MERISGKKGKRRVSTSRIVYFAATISLVILIALILRNPENKNGVTINKLDFIDLRDDEHYLKFDIDNPTDEPKTCLLNIRIGTKKYRGYVNISAKSKKLYKTHVDMPIGTTEIKLDYNCVNQSNTLN